MTRKLTNYAVVALAILTAELLHSIAHHYFTDYLKGSSVYKKVAISMIVAVVVFYPVFHLLEKYIKGASEQYLEGAKGLTRNRFTGLVVGFAAAMGLLFIGFSYAWYNKNALADIKTWVGGLL